MYVVSIFVIGPGLLILLLYTPSYDYETYVPPSTNGNGGLGFIGMQRCLDCSSSPIADLYPRWQAQGWASMSFTTSPFLRRLSCS